MKKHSFYISKGLTPVSTIMGELTSYMEQSRANDFELVIGEVKSKRSDLQNRLFHVICREFVELAKGSYLVFYGDALDLSHWNEDHFKAFLKQLYLTASDPKNETIKIVKNTSDLTIDQFTKFLEKVLNDFLENGGVLLTRDEDVYRGAMGL